MQTIPSNVRGNPENACELSPQEVKNMAASGEAQLIDVRERDEHERERIAGATLMPLSTFDPARVLSLIDSGKTVVIHCRGGVRGAEAMRRLAACAGADVRIVNMKGGIEGWKGEGLAVEVNSAVCRVSIMRQVQLVVGAGVLIGSALTWFVHPWFIAIPAFLGAGLTFAGATGICALASVLGAMPWNKGMRESGKVAGTSGSCSGVACQVES